MVKDLQRPNKSCYKSLVCGQCASKSISMWSVVILADLPHIPRRMPVQCSSAYHSLFVVLLLCANQYMDVQSFHLCPVHITIGQNTSIECCCPMWLSQRSSIKKMYFSDFGENIYTKCLAFFFFTKFENTSKF